MPSIGVFDSGCGGLTVLRQLFTVLPHAQYLYFGDTARLPYGSKSPDVVARYAIKAVHFLEQQGSGMIVVACNTATALALEAIRCATRLPVVGVLEPGVAEAAKTTRRRQVVVLATAATVSSGAYGKALTRHGIQAREKACPLLVPLVEEGWIEHSVTEQVARIYIAEAFADDFKFADVLLLGCTHYPLLTALLRRLVATNVSIVDSARATAHRVAAALGAEPVYNTDRPPNRSQEAKFFVSESPDKFCRLASLFLDCAIANFTATQIDLG